MATKPKLDNVELDKAEQQFEAYDKNIKDLTMDRLSAAPKPDVEPQTKISQRELDQSKDIYLKPVSIFGPGVDPKTGKKEEFNEKFREDYNFQKEYVKFIAENKEIIGEAIEIWTKKFPGVNCEQWKIPVNKPVWGPRYLAEQLKSKYYHRLKTEDRPTDGSNGMTYYGCMVVDTTIQRLDAVPVSTRRSIFMGAAA